MENSSSDLSSLPIVSIGITTYNARSSIGRALFSAKEQSWPSIEIIIVDDCSTDGTFEVISEFSKKNSNVRAYKNTSNLGVAASRNRIVAEATGEFLVFFDDDDESATDRIEKQFRRIVKFEQTFGLSRLVICHTARKIIYPNGEIRLGLAMGQALNKPTPQGIAVATHILLGAPLEGGSGACPTCSQMARLSTYKSLGGFDPAFRRSEDTEFNVRAALAGGHFVGVGEPLVTQTMTKTSEKSLEDEHFFTKKLIYKHRSFIEQHGSFKFCLAWLDLKQAWLTRQRINFFSNLIWLLVRFPVLSMKRLVSAIPNFALNQAFSRFHLEPGDQ